MRLKFGFFYIVLVLVLAACGDDDDGPQVQIVPPRLLSEVAAEDAVKLTDYLSSHFYNYEEFENPPEGFDFEVRIDSITGENTDKESILERAELSFIDFSISSDSFAGLEEEGGINHRLYYLNVREGAGVMPTIVDSVYIKYEGFRLDNTVFDSNVVWFDLQGTASPGNTGSFVRGFKEGIPLFKDGEDLQLNDDGTFTITDSGIGVIFMPSGLAYFNAAVPGRSYAPIAFKINMLEANEADHDRDGIPTRLEDLNNDGELLNDNTDGIDFPNYLDTDDDNDGILTREEINLNEDGTFESFRDTDGDGTPDHLDAN